MRPLDCTCYIRSNRCRSFTRRLFGDFDGPRRNKFDYFGAGQRPLANHDGGRQVSTVVQRQVGSERYTSAGGQVEVSREGDGRVTQAIVVRRDRGRVVPERKLVWTGGMLPILVGRHFCDHPHV